MRQNADPPSSEPPCRNQLFMIGRNSQGQWIVRDRSGLRGGLFIDRTEALRFCAIREWSPTPGRADGSGDPGARSRPRVARRRSF